MKDIRHMGASEKIIGGLDKSSRLYKRLGISGLVAAIFHWLSVNGATWAVDLGFMAAPEHRTPPAAEVDTETFSLESFLHTLRGAAESISEPTGHGRVMHFPKLYEGKLAKWLLAVPHMD